MPAQAPVWYIVRDGLQHGPVSHEQMRAAIIQGALLPTDLIWHAGLPKWESAHAVLGVKGQGPPPPAAPMPPGLPPPSVPPLAKPVAAQPAPAGAPAATAGTTTGIVAIIFGVLGLIPPVGVGLALIGLILGLVARRRSDRAGNKAGVKLGTIAMVLSGTTFAIVTAVLVFLGSKLGAFSLPNLPFLSDTRLARYHGTYQCAGRRFEIGTFGVKIDGKTIGRYSTKPGNKPAWASEQISVSYGVGSFDLRRNLVGTVFVDDDACMRIAKPK